MDKFIGKPLTLSFVVMTTIAVAAGCGGESVPAAMQHVQDAPRDNAAESTGGSLPPGLHQGEMPVLRSRMDVSRNRLWVLVADGVNLYDAKTRQRIAQVPLPGWHWAGEPFSCAPDLAVGRQGEALVSSDILPVIWRVDPDTLAVTRHELALDADTDKDVGFSGLAHAAGHGGFFAMSPLHGSLWRIDSSLTRAQKLALSTSVPRSCGLAVYPRALQQQPGRKTSLAFDLCVRTGADHRTILLSPDQRSGHVSSRSCGT